MNENNAVKYIRCAAKTSSKQTLLHTKALLNELALTPGKVKLIKVYGEVGKSLLALRLSHMLSASGFRVGILSLSHPERASRDCIFVNGEVIPSTLFAESVGKVSEALQKETLSFATPTDEEILLASGLLALKKEDCRFVILEISARQNSASAALDDPLLSIITPIYDLAAAKNICALLDKNHAEAVSAWQISSIQDLITNRCVSINRRRTYPILANNLYIMDYTLGKIRFCYGKKEYIVASGAKYELYAAILLIECYQALLRSGVRLTSSALTSALIHAPATTNFHVFSVSPTLLLDAADTPVRLEAVWETIAFQKQILGDTVAIWTSNETLSEINLALKEEDAPSLHLLTCLDEKNIYRSVKLALRERNPNVPLLILGTADFICHVERILKGFL